METSPFLLLLRRRWWLLLLGVVPTVLLSAVQARGDPPVYESTSTFVVRPVEADAERVMRAMDTLLRGVEINTTYANIVGSRHVSDRALELLDLTDEQRDGLSASGKVITGTSILEIRVAAGTPQVAHDYAEAVAAETLTYINELENGFGLVPLDPPTLPRSASGPGTMVTLAVSGMLGSLLGLGLVFASGQLAPLGGRQRFDIVDPTTGASTEAFLLKRMREEVARIDRGGGALTVALVVPSDTSWRGRLLGRAGLSRTAELLRAELREADILAYVGRGRFAILALDRIAPELGSQLRAAHPALAVRVAETTYVGEADGGGHPLDDPARVLRRLEEELVTGAPGAGVPRDEARVSVWTGP